jgi:hemerythrin-like metal-binding protein
LTDKIPAQGPLLVWKDQFATGMPGVDHEHRQLIELINGLFEKMGRNCSGELTREFLGEIYARISGHFALEEKVMREARYDQYAIHKADHERLLDQLRDIMDRAVEDEGYCCCEDLGADLEQWFSLHFRTHDPRLHAQLGDH